MHTEVEVALKHFLQPTRVGNVGLEPPGCLQHGASSPNLLPHGDRLHMRRAVSAAFFDHASPGPHKHTRLSAAPYSLPRGDPEPIVATAEKDSPVPGDRG